MQQDGIHLFALSNMAHELNYYQNLDNGMWTGWWVHIIFCTPSHEVEIGNDLLTSAHMGLLSTHALMTQQAAISLLILPLSSC